MSSIDLHRITKAAKALAHPYRITRGRDFRLEDVDPEDTGALKREDKPRARDALEEGIQALAELQTRLFAQNRWAVLLIFQAMDAAGKDSAVKHVMSGVNPQGCQVMSFKAPSSEELDHDYLWRCVCRLPERGRIGIFNRSYYEEVLIARVHPEILERQRLPPETTGKKNVWRDRFRDIANFEQYLVRNGTLVRKFFLHVSRKEQKKRFLERIETSEKNWKFEATDVKERAHWKEYMRAYEEMIRETSSPEAPWYVVPANNKWFTRAVVAAAIIEALDSLDLRYPRMSKESLRELALAQKALLAE
jgi:PPK2 family polyphosphate:nucleotide phosphotransferase